MENKILADESWEIVRRFLPGDLERSAREHGAIRRARGEIRSAGSLLRLIILHAAEGLSLEQAALRARERKLVNISAVGLFKRLRSSGPWLSKLTAELTKDFSQDGDDAAGKGRAICVLDAADIEEPGPTGKNWRLHYALAMPGLRGERLMMADAREAGKKKRLPVEAGDIVLCEQGVASPPAVAWMLAREADVVMRLESEGFPLEDERGKALDAVKLGTKLRIGKVGDWPVVFRQGGRRIRMRLCALRKSRAAAASAPCGLADEAREELGEGPPEALKLAAFVVVLTSLPVGWGAASRILELERARWRMEPALKRLRRLLAGGPVPKTSDSSGRAWLQARILTSVVIERMIRAGCHVSPWGYGLEEEAQAGRP